MGVKARLCRGQMTIELAVGIPVLLALALVVMNAMLFLSECAAFDGLARDSIRAHACAPGYGQTPADAAAAIQADLEEAFPEAHARVSVSYSGVSLLLMRYEACLHFTPTLFGRPFAGEAFGVGMASIDHRVALVVDTYRPGAVL